MDSEIQEWLMELPLNTEVDLGGERVYLKVLGNGAELGARLVDGMSGEQMQAALQNAFASAIEFNAGLAYTADGSGLALTCWLPDVYSWSAARAALESLLNQLAVWRRRLASSPNTVSSPPLLSREEMQMRSRLLAKTL